MDYEPEIASVLGQIESIERLSNFNVHKNKQNSMELFDNIIG